MSSFAYDCTDLVRTTEMLGDGKMLLLEFANVAAARFVRVGVPKINSRGRRVFGCVDVQ